jgi:hypothetical protein
LLLRLLELRRTFFFDGRSVSGVLSRYRITGLILIVLLVVAVLLIAVPVVVVGVHIVCPLAGTAPVIVV